MSEEGKTMHDKTVGGFFIVLVLAGLIWLVWHLYQVEMRNFVRWLRYAEMWLMSPFIPEDYTVNYQGKTVNWHESFKAIKKWDPAGIENIHVHYATIMALQPMKYIFAGLMMLGGVWAMVAGPRTHNRKNLGLEGLINYQARNFPVIKPFIKFNPSKQPPRPPGSPVPAELPIFAEALGPEEWLAYNQIPIPDGKIHAPSMIKAMRKQLIGRWKGWKNLRPYQQILLAAFALKAARKRKESDDLLGRLAVCWSHDKGLKLNRKLITEAHKILRNKSISEGILTEANRHAFVTTAMLRALQYAREEGGVLAPSQFVWLRAHDRTLWYPMNNLGRQSFHMEALGAMTHFKEERLTKRPIPTPKVETTVDTMTEYLESIHARPIPELDYSNSKKKAIKKAV